MPFLTEQKNLQREINDRAQGNAVSVDRLNSHLASTLENRRRLNETVVMNVITPPASNVSGIEMSSHASKDLELDSSGLSHASRAMHGDKTKPERNARWGVSEGGIDGLGWVRSLVNVSESSPLASGLVGTMAEDSLATRG